MMDNERRHQQPPLRRRARVLLCCAALLLALPSACAQHAAPSLVSQGQRYHVGEPEFDAYFEKLYAIQVILDAGSKQDAEARKSLTRVLGEDQEGSSSTLAKAVRRRSQALARAGSFLRFELEDDDETSAQAELVLSGRRPPESEQAFLKTLSSAAQDELKLSLRMLRAKRELVELRFRALQLDKRIDDTFRLSGPRKKAEVRANLEDAVALIPILIVRADEVQQDADKLLDKLVDATRVDSSGAVNAVTLRGEDEPFAKPKAGAVSDSAPSVDARESAPRATPRRRPRAAARPAQAAAKPAPAPAAKPAPPAAAKPAAAPATKPVAAPAADFEP
jgi:hypothetical protein